LSTAGAEQANGVQWTYLEVYEPEHVKHVAPQKCPSLGKIWTPSSSRFLQPIRVCPKIALQGFTGIGITDIDTETNWLSRPVVGTRACDKDVI